MKNANLITQQPLQISSFAKYVEGTLQVDTQERSFKMANSDGTGDPLVSYKDFGADIIRFEASLGVQPHVHSGHHILFVLSGEGWLTYGVEKHKLSPGICYLIPGDVRHAIDAKTDLVLIAVGNEHRPVDSDERMTPTE